eukprot:6491312-Amphidinium_carterae.4
MQAHRVAQKCKIGAHAFLQQHADVWPLVLPLKETTTLMELAEDANLYEHKSDLRTVMQSRVGAKIFGWLWKSVARKALQQQVTEELDTLKQMAKVTEGDINSSQARVMLKLDEFSELPELSSKRTVKVAYGAMSLKIEVKSLLSELVMHYAAFVKAHAVQAGALTPFGPERDTANADRDQTDGPTFDSALLLKYASARASAETILAAGKHSNTAESMEALLEMKKTLCYQFQREAVQEVTTQTEHPNHSSVTDEQLKLHARKLKEADQTWAIEMAMLAFFQDGGAVEALRQAILKALPTEALGKSLDDSLADIRATQKTTLFAWADADAQAQVRVVENMVSGLQESVVPTEGGNSTDFVKTCRARMAYYARVTKEVVVKTETDEKETKPVTLVGREAVEHQWQEFRKLQKEGTIDLNNFQILAQHRWLLPTGERAKVEKAMTALESRTSAPSTSSSSTKPSKSGQVQSEVKRKAPKITTDAKKQKVQSAPKTVEEQVDDLFLG